MYAIVVGGGKVGYYLAKELLDNNHEVLVIEQDAAKCERINQELGEVAMQGDGCEVAVMEQAGVGRADMVIAVTGDDEDNLVTCQVAKLRFNVPRTIARINNPKNEAIFKALGIDATVSSTTAILAHIEEELPTHPLIHLLTLRGGGLELVEMKIPQNASVVGKKLKEVLLPQESLVCFVYDAEGIPRLPNPETVLHAGDEVVAVTRQEYEPALRTALSA